MLISKEKCMKRRIGFLLLLSGIILMIRPDMNVEQVSLFMNYVVVHYWPLALIMVGMSMMNKKQKQRRK